VVVCVLLSVLLGLGCSVFGALFKSRCMISLLHNIGLPILVCFLTAEV